MSHKITILSIDDEEDIRYALKAVFDFQGWDSYLAKDVDEGMALFLKHKPDIVLMDYHLPRVNGIKGVEMIRQISTKVPIIVFTIDESQQVANSFLEAGASDFALKPIKAPDLISRINLHIRLLESQQALKETTRSSVPKGISTSTLALVEDALGKEEEFLDVGAIAEITGLAPQTAYRYLQYLQQENILETRQDYGKVGRPKLEYRFIK